YTSTKVRRPPDRLGDNTFNQLSIPSNLQQVRAMSVGSFHTVALAADGKVVAWGKLQGRVEDMNINDAYDLRVPSNLERVTAISTGAFHSLALHVNGTVSVWGNNSYDQLDVP